MSGKVMCAVLIVLLLAGSPAWADPGRGVLTNGRVHKVTINSSDRIQVELGTPVNGLFTVDKDDSGRDLIFQGYTVCRTINKAPGEGLAVFNNQIFYAYTADTACGQTAKSQSAFVATFDLRQREWIALREIGKVHIDNYAQGTTSGAAITVFNNKLYLFTDSGIFTSSDGTAWEGPHHALEGFDYQPLDAVTVFPPDAKMGKILIIYGINGSGGAANTYDNIKAALWNGKLPTPWPYSVDDYYEFPLFLFSGTAGILGRVSLLPGTAGALGWGRKAPSAQLFANVRSGNAAGSIRHGEFTFETTGPSWRLDPVLYPDGTKYPGTGSGSVAGFFAYPWSVLDCVYLPERQAMRQVLLAQWKDNTTAKGFSWGSDALVPQNKDIPMACGLFGGTPNDMGLNDPNLPDPDNIRKNYWTLIGVILGSPPFAPNGLEEQGEPAADRGAISNLHYGRTETQKVSDKVETSHQMMLSLGMTVRAGFPEVFSDKFSIDTEFKNTWEKSRENTTSTDVSMLKTFGTGDATWPDNGTLGEVGRLGWALFSVPRIVVQNWKAYAWDYSADDGTGTPLNQTMYTIEAEKDSNYIKQISFDLANPQGVMAGMTPMNHSTAVRFWETGLPWDPDANDSRWTMKFGSHAVGESPRAPLLTWSPSSGSDENIATKAETVVSKGSTRELNIVVENNLSFGTKLNGFSMDEKAGYSGVWKTDVSHTTGFGTDVFAGLHMKSCKEEGPGCVKALDVQPYWLEATSAEAPWIPTAFKNQRPWCITWKVWYLDQIQAAMPMATLTRMGTALAPQNASGRIVNGTGGDDGGGPESHYSIQGGRLAWLDHFGAEQRVPMSAAEFEPGKGVTIEVNGRSWSSLGADGTWKRSGNTWTFQSRESTAKQRVQLKLDFEAARYDLQIQQADLDGRVLAGSTDTRLVLGINDRYTFHTLLRHDIDITWRWSQPAGEAGGLQVTSFDGRYNSATQNGKMALAGTLPAELPAFGDVGIEINEHPYIAKLVALEEFQRAFQAKTVFRYSKEGFNLVLDFAGRKWSATFNNQAFNKMLTPLVGKVRARILVGGAPRFQRDAAVVNYSANLTLSK